MKLKANTVRRWTRSLFNLGKRVCWGVPATVAQDTRHAVLRKFREILRETRGIPGIYGVV